MPDLLENRRNWAAWSGFLLAVGAILCNVVFFAHPPGQVAIPWLSLLLAVVALILVAVALKRVFWQPRIFRGRILSSIVCGFSLLLAGMAIFAFVHARELPHSAGAPQVGQKAPGFTLADTNGHQVSLDQLVAPAAGDPQSVAPKAVLLVFYRGYW
ncbi:MAG: hypothetical protein ACRD2S_02895 [Terriglobales bacterium]